MLDPQAFKAYNVRGLSMVAAVCEGAAAGGAEVLDIRMVGTEMLYFAVRRCRFASRSSLLKGVTAFRSGCRSVVPAHEAAETIAAADVV